MKSSPAVLLFITLCCFAFEWSHAEASEAVPLPCGDEKTALRDCEKVKVESIDLLQKKVQDQVDRWYRGDDPFYPRVCSLTPNLFNKKQEEFDVDHFGKSCGQWSSVSAWNCGSRRKPRACAQVNSSGSLGSRDRAYMAGAYVQATQCQFERVRSEIRSGKLSLEACKQMGHDFEGSLSTLMSRTQALGEQKLRQLVDKCAARKKGEQSGEADPGADSSDMDEVNCRMVAERAGHEAIFQELAACEVLARAKKAYDRFDFELFQPSTVQSRHTSWVNSCGGGNPNGCYQSQFINFLKAEVNKRFGRCG